MMQGMKEESGAMMQKMKEEIMQDKNKNKVKSYEDICRLALSRVESTANSEGEMPEFHQIIKEMNELLDDAEAFGFTNLSKMNEMSMDKKKSIVTPC